MVIQLKSKLKPAARRIIEEAAAPLMIPSRKSGVRTSGEDPESFGGFLAAVGKACDHNNLERRKAGEKLLDRVYGTEFSVLKTAMGELSGTTGGYIVPRRFSDRLLNVIAEESFILPRANVIPMDGPTVQCPKVQVEKAPSAAGISPFFGSVQFKWGQSQAPAETEPAWRQVELTAWDLTGYCTASNQWVWDSGEMGNRFLLNLFGRAAAWYVEYAILNGLGAGGQMPLGILKAPGSLSVSRAAGGAIAVADLASMSSQLLPYSWKRAIWACSVTALAKIQALSTYFINGYSGDPADAAHDGRCGLLLNKPLFVTELLPALGTTGDIVLFDPTLYAVGMRQEILIDTSSVGPAFRTNQTDYRVWLRVDGKPQVDSTITLQDTSTVVSPYLYLHSNP